MSSGDRWCRREAAAGCGGAHGVSEECAWQRGSPWRGHGGVGLWGVTVAASVSGEGADEAWGSGSGASGGGSGGVGSFFDTVQTQALIYTRIHSPL